MAECLRQFPVISPKEYAKLTHANRRQRRVYAETFKATHADCQKDPPGKLHGILTRGKELILKKPTSSTR